jgi:hypothetical protein
VKSWAVLVGILIAVLGLVGLISPDTYARLGWFWSTPPGLYVVVPIQIALALVLLRVAPSSRSPVGLGVVAAFALGEAILMPLLGPGREHAIAEWWGGQTTGLLRLWALLELIVGVLVVLSVAPRRPALRPAASST